LCGLVAHEPIALEITRGRERSLEFSVRKKGKQPHEIVAFPCQSDQYEHQRSELCPNGTPF
jgi:hypothetical protein